MQEWKGPLEQIDEFRWRIPETYQDGMRVPGIIYAGTSLVSRIKQDQAPAQVANVAHLPGLAGPSLAMPDIHWGYGFPIGGVAAVFPETGVISPGGVGYDINCGVRLIRTALCEDDIRSHIGPLVTRLFETIPCGVGGSGSLKLTNRQLKEVLRRGAGWAVQQGYGWELDTIHSEEQGQLKGADPLALSPRALDRGKPQLGTLGSGNHFLEIQKVAEIFNEEAAAAYGLYEGQIVVMIHSGSRGLGYQVCDDNLDRMVKAMHKYRISVPDQQLCCTPVSSPEGKLYFAAMAAAANYAWANRQLLTHGVRRVFAEYFKESPENLGMHLVYDVAHNIAKFERHSVAGETRELLVHRKGATRAFSPEHPDLPRRYHAVGQPVLIPGDMGTASYVLHGTDRAMEETFGSCCHGAGRVMSRRAAVRYGEGRSISSEMQKKGIFVRSRGRQTLLEEAPHAYKDIDAVIDTVHMAGLAGKVAKMKPLGVIKG